MLAEILHAAEDRLSVTPPAEKEPTITIREKPEKNNGGNNIKSEPTVHSK